MAGDRPQSQRPEPRVLRESDLPALQRFFDSNPEYFLAVGGEPPRADEAEREFRDVPPAGMAYRDMFLLGWFASDDELVAMATVVGDLIAEHVWHIGLFIVSTRLHGAGVAQELYDGVEGWMKARGARWSRLGVVAGNARAERFWERLGYKELRMRRGVAMGKRTNDIRVMMKPLTGGSVAQYFALVVRDRPETD